MSEKPASTEPGVSSTASAKVEPPTASTATEPASTTTPKDSTKATPKARKPGYTNPAFKAMGLPPLRLPSRNWMIFWAVVSAGVGGYAYDRYQVKQVRKKYMQRVEHLGQAPLQPNVKARRLTVYVAPPPSDYLDESLAVFRRYVKPVLNAGGVDFEIKSENRQGVIRSLVAADVRALRREYLEAEQKKKEIADSKKWYNRAKSWFSRSKPVELSDEEMKKIDALTFDYKELLGTYYKNEQWTSTDIIDEDSLVSDPTAQGGVICVGRGAYKEYLTGLHEGLLGPLDKPVDHDEFEKPQDKEAEELGVPTGTDAAETVVTPEVKTLDEIVAPEKVQENIEQALNPTEDTTTEAITTASTTEFSGTSETASITATTTDESKPDESKSEDSTGVEPDNDFDGQKSENLLPIPKAFITPTEYPSASYAPEFPATDTINTSSGVSAIFQQPILVIPVYHLLGFLNTPWRIYRFYNQRKYAEEYGRGAVAVVESIRSRYQLDHVDWAKDEEEDWPKKWVEKGKEKASEWTRELVTDERVLEKLWVYDTDKVVEKVEQPERKE